MANRADEVDNVEDTALSTLSTSSILLAMHKTWRLVSFFQLPPSFYAVKK